MDTEFPVDRLEKAILGIPCWYALAGEGSGSIIQLYLGAKLRLKEAKPNTFLSEQARWHKAEYGLMVWCAWRLDSAYGPITGWLEPNDNDGPMVMGLSQLEGESVTRVRVVRPAWDLDLEFTGEKTLRVFCDRTANTERYENWSILGPNGFMLAVDVAGTWTDQERV